MTIKQLGGVFGRNPTFNDVTIEGQLTFEGNIDIDSDITWEDNKKALFGNDGDLQIYHDGSHSYVSDQGTGNLRLLAENFQVKNAADTEAMIVAVPNAGVSLYYNNLAKLTTASSGVSFNGNVIMQTSGSGIDFSATAGTGTSELLDDYEEGVWTPVLSDASSGGNLGSATINKANYTKVGRSVTLSASLSDIVTTGMGSSLSLYIQGLPFTSASSNSSFGVVKIDSVALQGGRTSAVCEVSDSDAWLRFWAIGDAIADTPIDCGDITSGSSDIFFTINYHV